MNDERVQLINIVKKQFEKKKRECGDNTDEITKQRLEFISNMLNNDRCFFELRKGVAIEILCFIGFTDDEAFKLYDKLTDYELFKGNFEFTNINDQVK